MREFSCARQGPLLSLIDAFAGRIFLLAGDVLADFRRHRLMGTAVNIIAKWFARHSTRRYFTFAKVANAFDFACLAG